METTLLSWSFGDPIGSTVAGVVFVALAGGIGFMVYGASYRLLTMGSLDETHRVSHRFSLALGLLFALVIFSACYATTLSGFFQLDLQGGQLTFHYMLPERIHTVAVEDVADLREEPAFKGQWRLIVTTADGDRYESVLATHEAVRQAEEALIQRVARSGSLRR